MPTDYHALFPADEEKKKAEQARANAQRKVILAYKRVFATDSGKVVLEDLKRQFGWERWEAEDTENSDLIARRCSAKGPIFHIEKQLRTVFSAGKPKRKSTTPSP